jgi:predicted acylesterase/phospholipase RssA
VTADAGCPIYPKTNFFQACRGVFEGGGCRGAAHVGAYYAAIECGINFSEVAGTSAGSIVAALVGAGATPQFLISECAYTPFAEFLAPPEGRIGPPWWARALSPFVRGTDRVIGRILWNGSAFSSGRLEQWLDGLLAKLLPNAKPPILFEDLLLPTWIVATDLGGRRPKVWSTKNTPKESVAMAVRASCSIPLFFEPVEIGNNMLVDGGMLSNLPSFVFADRPQSHASIGGRVLGFRLVADATAALDRTFPSLLGRLVDTSISAATEVQCHIQGNVSVVEIPTGTVSSLNFNISHPEVESLLESGRTAVRNFVRDEHAHLNDIVSSDIARFGEDELFDDLVREMAVPGKRLVVACENTHWFWDLFPSVIHWMFSGAHVDVIVPTGMQRASELQRREFLRRLGVRIVELTNPPQRCFVLSRQDYNHNALFVLGISDSQFMPTGAVYIGIKHRPVIEAFLAGLDQLLPPAGGVNHAPKLSLRRAAAEPLFALLKAGVHQYGLQDVSVEMKDVALNSTDVPVKMIVSRVRSFKYRQVAYLHSLYQRAEIEFCEPADIYSGEERVSTVLPPIFESHGSSLIAIEGNSRVLYLHKLGRHSVRAFVVNGVSAPLPGIPVSPKEALLATYELATEYRIKGLKQDYFRSIERAVRPIE